MKNYIEEALRTKSNQFHTDGVRPDWLTREFYNFNLASKGLGIAKAAIFYGKNKIGELEDPISLEHPYYAELSDQYRVDFLHGVLGIASESSELIQCLVDSKFDPVNLKEELGDILWYIAILCNVVGCSIEDLMELNINKLKARYPDKFTSENAINRDLEAERNILEK